MKGIIFAVLICFSFGLPVQPKLDEQKVDELNNGKLSKFILAFAQLSSMLERPLVDLDFAVQDLSEDLKEMQEEVSQDFFQRSAQHKKIIDDLDVLLGNAQIEISNSINLVENVLKNQLVQLNNKQSSLQDFVSQNRVAIQREDLMHQTNSKQYEEKITDHQTALKILDKALDIVQKFISGELDINQRDPVQRDVQELSGCLNKRYGNYPLVAALIESVPTFENMKQLKKIRQKLVKIKQAVQDQYNEDLFHDRTQTSLYEKRKAQLEKEHSIFQQQIADNMFSINTIQQKIKVEEDFQDMRRDDVKRYAQQRQDENEAFAYEIAIFQDLKNMYLTEQQLSEQAVNFINTKQFSDLLRSNLDIALRKK
ncbi:unnamed protein product [Paramecium sonneborni]|uniref:Trichocyst matrix protein n=1 Tax=Paramecium sonneborni TaxID=65129 RepID=A0A8S1RA36_9CILI|nr:unnamed protein product [Paramecium sonneborni]